MNSQQQNLITTTTTSWIYKNTCIHEYTTWGCNFINNITL